MAGSLRQSGLAVFVSPALFAALGCSGEGGGMAPPDAQVDAPTAPSIEWIAELPEDADPTHGIDYIAVDQTSVVLGGETVRDAAAAYAWPRSGGAVAMLGVTPDGERPVAFARDADHVYIVTYPATATSVLDGALYRIPIGGGPAVRLHDAEGHSPVLVDAERVYIVPVSTVIGISKLDGSESPFPVSDGDCQSPDYLARAGDRLFTQGTVGLLCAAPAAGGSVAPLEVAAGPGLVGRGDTLYYFQGSMSQDLMRLAVPSGTPELLLDGDRTGRHVVTTDGTTFFYTAHLDFGYALFRFTVGDTQSDMIAATIGPVIDLDDQYVYVSSGRSLGRVPRTAPAR